MSRVSTALVGAAIVLALAGCAATTGSGSVAPAASEVATAPATPTSTSTPTPGVAAGTSSQAQLAELPMPSAGGPVLAVGTVIDAGTPMLCLNVATSYPPQCGGPAIVGWDWSAVPHEEASSVRWADGVALRVTYDAEAFAITPIEPPLDLAAITMPAREIPAGDLDEASFASLQADLLTLDRADVQGHGGENGTYVVDVVYDDGSMQAAFDGIYGPGVIHVTSWFID